MDAIAVQMDIAWEDWQANCRRAERMLAEADVAPGSLVVLPEMFAWGFTMNAALAAAEAGGPVERFLSDLAKRSASTVVAGVVRPGAAGRGRNEAVVFAPDGRFVGRYCKIHPFRFAGEHEHYEAGQSAITLELDDVRLCPLVCYDLRFPETFRDAVGGGAELFAVIANWPAERARHWRVLLQARAVENQAIVVGVNRVGRDPNVAYAGGSLIVDADGSVLAEAGEDACVLRAAVDPGALRAYRREFPVLGDIRRPPER